MKEKLYRFMQDRYGSDQMNRFLIIVAVVCFVLCIPGPDEFYLLGLAGLFYAYFRMLSKNIYKRSAENSAYLKYEYRVKQYFGTLKRDWKQRKTHHIYRCPSCRQKVRIPKGKGKIEIRCPKCSTTFIKNS